MTKLENIIEQMFVYCEFNCYNGAPCGFEAICNNTRKDDSGMVLGLTKEQIIAELNKESRK